MSRKGAGREGWVSTKCLEDIVTKDRILESKFLNNYFAYAFSVLTDVIDLCGKIGIRKLHLMEDENVNKPGDSQ